MKAVKLQATVDKRRRIVIDVPADIAEGPVELILLGQEAVEHQDTSLRDFLESMLARPGHRSKHEIDAQVAEERSAWD